MDASGGDRSGDEDRAGVSLNFDAVIRATRVDRERAERARSHGEGSHARRGGREDEAVDRDGAVEGRGDDRTDRVDGTEVEGLSQARQGDRRRRAVGIIGPASEGAPRSAGDAVEVAINDRAGSQHERGAAGGGGVELVVQADRCGAQDPVGEVQAAARGEERVSARGDAAEAVKIERHRTADGGTATEDDRVVGARGTEVEAEGGTAAKTENRGPEGDRRGVEEIQRRAVGDIDGRDTADGEASAEGALRHRRGAAAEIDRAGDRHLAETGLGEIGRGSRAGRASEIERGEAVRDVERGAGRTEGEILTGGDADGDRLRAGADVGERASVDGDGTRAEVGAAGEGHRAGVDLELTGEAIGARKRDESRGGLDDIDAREDGRDRAEAEVERLGRGQRTGGTGDRAGREDDLVDGLIEGRHVERAAIDSQERGVVEDAARAERQGSGGDGGAAIERIDAREAERACSDLGQAGADAIDSTSDGHVTGATDREGVRTSDDRGRTSEEKCAGVGLDQRRSREGDLTVEGVVAAEITQRTGAADARAGDRQSLGSDGREAEEFKGRARGDGRAADRGAEGARVRDAERADVDGDGAVEGVRAGERKLARAVLDEAGRGAGDGARGDEVTRAVEGDDVGTGHDCGRVTKREGARVGLDQRVAAEGDRAAEGIDAAEAAEGAGGTDARAGNRESLASDGDAAAKFEGCAVRDSRGTQSTAEGGRVTDGEKAGGDRREAVIAARAREEDRASARKGQRAGARDSVRGRIGTGAVNDERRVVNHRARTERARGQTRTDLERARGDRELAAEAVVTFEDERACRRLREGAAAVDFRHVHERAGFEEHVVDRTGQRTNRIAVQVERGVVELDRRGDRGEAVADALGDRVADVDRAARDENGGRRVVTRGRGAAQRDRSVERDRTARDID